MPAAPTGLALPAGQDFLPHRLPAGTGIHRVHWADKGPVFFGPKPGLPPANRFDAPAGEYRTLYAAERFEGAFVETVLRDPARRIIDPANVAARAWTVVALRRDVVLAKLFDEGLRWHGVDGAVSTIADYRLPRAVALALFSRFPGLDGVAYRSRHNDGQVCYAIFDRVHAAELDPGPPAPLAHRMDLAERVIREHGGALDRSAPVPPPAAG
jgi:hypothetical protein